MRPERRFAFRLAYATGWVNPDAMLAAIPWRIWQEWIQYHNEEPFGQLPMRIGFAASGLGNLLGRQKGKPAWKATDFMPDVDYDPQRQQEHKPGKTADQQVGHIMWVSKMMGWPVIDKRADKQRGEKRPKRASD